MKALILVDIQKDFLPTGKLRVPNGDEVIAVANFVQPKFELVVATQDWHPENHESFAANHEGKSEFEEIELHGLTQILWPKHCVQNSDGADFAEHLDTTRFQGNIFQKGMDPTIDSYSGFLDNANRNPSGLDDFLKSRKVTDVFVMGLATDFCVLATAMDANDMGYATHVVKDGCRAVDPSAGEKCFENMKRAGIKIVTSQKL